MSVFRVLGNKKQYDSRTKEVLKERASGETAMIFSVGKITTVAKRDQIME